MIQFDLICTIKVLFSARCNIYISRLCYDVSVRLSVTEVHSDTTLPRIAVLLAGVSSRAMLASARSLV